MKKILCLFAVLTASLNATDISDYHFNIFEKRHSSTKFFEIDSKNTNSAIVKKTKLRLRTNYDLSTRKGTQAKGIVRMFSLGNIFNWAKQIDIYNTKGKFIGAIEGFKAATEELVYYLFDKNKTITAIAHLDHTCGDFTLSSPNPHSSALAILKNDKNFFSVNVYNSQAVDERILKIFAAFVVDYQNEFKKYYLK